MAIFGIGLFNITYSAGSVNFTPTDYKFIMNESQVRTDMKLHTSAINGFRTLIDKGDGDSYLEYDITIFGLQADDWTDVFKKIAGQIITFTPHIDSTLSFNALVVEARPFYHNSNFYKDSIKLKIVSQGYVDLIEI